MPLNPPFRIKVAPQTGLGFAAHGRTPREQIKVGDRSFANKSLSSLRQITLLRVPDAHLEKFTSAAGNQLSKGGGTQLANGKTPSRTLRSGVGPAIPR